MKTIALAGLNARYTHSNLAIRYLREMIRDLPWQTVTLEYNINQDIFSILADLTALNPDVIAFSVYIWNSTYVKKLLPEIKKLLPETKIILGGPEVTYQATLWLEKYSWLDFIICGPGEAAFRKLAESDFSSGIKIINGEQLPFNQIPFPYQPEDFPSLNGRYIYYESSRGCPFRCSYCLSSREDQHLDLKNISLVKQEIVQIMKYKPQIIKFVDRTFNADHHHSRSLWQFLADNYTSSGTRFHFEINPALLTTEDFKLLQQIPAGMFQFEIGIQTTNPEALKMVNRTGDWQLIKKNLMILRDLNNIALHVDLLIGLPAETRQTFTQSFNEVVRLNIEHVQLGFLKVLPGTSLAEKSSQYGMISTDEPPYSLLSNNWMSFLEICQLKNLENIFNIIYNSGFFTITLHHLFEYYHPFEFFEDLLKIWQHTDPSLSLRKPERLSLLVYDLVILKADPAQDFLLDCLRWDWCRKTSSANYPPHLLAEDYRRIREKGQMLLKNLPDNNYQNSDYRRMIFFSPLTADFQTLYLDNREMAVFIPTATQKRIILI